jgi:hypothetical protein
MPVAGYRMYRCCACGHEFKEPAAQCCQLVSSPCPKCGAECSQWASEPRPEWLVDESGNLMEGDDAL